MTWSVVAALVGVAVTAALGGIALAREQTPLRQLERVTLVLKDMPKSAEARTQLEWLQAALSRRVSLRYRAPRMRRDLFVGWWLVFFGVGLEVVAVWILGTVAFWPAHYHDAAARYSAGALILAGAGAAVIVIGILCMRSRAKTRMSWVENTLRTDISTAPLI